MVGTFVWWLHQEQLNFYIKKSNKKFLLLFLKGTGLAADIIAFANEEINAK